MMAMMTIMMDYDDDGNEDDYYDYDDDNDF